jgi:hypothetical protein
MLVVLCPINCCTVLKSTGANQPTGKSVSQIMPPEVRYPRRFKILEPLRAQTFPIAVPELNTVITRKRCAGGV